MRLNMTQSKIKCMKDLEIFSALDESEKKWLCVLLAQSFSKRGNQFSWRE